MSLRPLNYEFQEWWKKVREENVITFVNPTVSYGDPLSTVKIPTPSLDSRVKKEPSHNAGHLLKFQQASASSNTYVSCSSFPGSRPTSLDGTWAGLPLDALAADRLMEIIYASWL